MIKTYKLRQRRRRAAGSKTSKRIGTKGSVPAGAAQFLCSLRARPAMFGKCSDENKE